MLGAVDGAPALYFGCAVEVAAVVLGFSYPVRFRPARTFKRQCVIADNDDADDEGDAGTGGTGGAGDCFLNKRRGLLRRGKLFLLQLLEFPLS